MIFMFHDVQREFRAVIAIKWFATKSCIQLIKHALKWRKWHNLSCKKSRIICYAKNVKNNAIFVEGFWPEFYARGRLIKYSMSGFCTRGILFLQTRKKARTRWHCLQKFLRSLEISWFWKIDSSYFEIKLMNCEISS